MQCDQFEVLWQRRLDAGEDPRLDEHLVAHSLFCAECNELLEGSEHLLSIPTIFAERLQTTVETLPSPCPQSIEKIQPASVVSSAMYRDRSARWPSMAAALIAVVAITLWGRVWMGLADKQYSVASAQRAVEDSIAGVNSPRAAAAAATSEIVPWVPSPLQIALRVRESRYLLDNTDPLVLEGWRAAMWEYPPNSSEFWIEGLEPLTSSWELAVQVLRSTLPLNWTFSEDSYSLWLSPAE